MIIKLDFHISTSRKRRPQASYWMVEDRDGNEISLKEAIKRGLLKLLDHEPSGVHSSHPSRDVYYFRVLDPGIRLIEVRKTWHKPEDLKWPLSDYYEKDSQRFVETGTEVIG